MVVSSSGGRVVINATMFVFKLGSKTSKGNMLAHTAQPPLTFVEANISKLDTK
jgi:hypothetical protein